MKRAFPGILICVAMLLWTLSASGQEGSSAGGAAAEAPEKITLRIPQPLMGSASVGMRALRAVYDEFVRTHPHIKLNASSGLVLEGGGGSNELLGIAGGVSPDVFRLYYFKMHTYIDQGFLLPMDKFIDTWEGEAEVPDQLWEVATGADGRRYGAVFTWPTNYLIYRRDLFRQVGLDPDRPPANWDELFEAAKRITRPDLRVATAYNPEAGRGRYGLFLPFNSVYNFSNFVWQADGEFIEKRDDGRWEAIFNQEGGVKALEFYKKLAWTKWERGGKRYTGVIRTGMGEAQGYRESKLFAKGEVAMVIMGLHRLQDIVAENVVRLEDVGIAALPAGPGGTRASIVDGEVYCMASRLKDDPARQRAAWEYIKFMTSETARRIQTKVYVEGGAARFVQNPHWLEQFGYQEHFDELDPQHVKAYDEALKYGRPEPYAPNYIAVIHELQDALGRVIQDPDADPAEELDKVAKHVNLHIYKLYPEEGCAGSARSPGGLRRRRR